MYHSNLELVKHIHDECELVIKHTLNISFDEFFNDTLRKRAVERSIEIIEEASKKLNDEFKLSHSGVKWKEMSGTRNIIIHEYAGVDYEIVWQIVKHEIPELLFQTGLILKENS
jgi:uncharacterized protein with HEPN domain